MESCSKCNFNCQPYGGCKSLNLIQKRTGCFFETVRKSLKRAENRLLLTCHSTTVIYKTRVRSLIYLQLGLFFQLIYFSQVHILSSLYSHDLQLYLPHQFYRHRPCFLKKPFQNDLPSLATPYRFSQMHFSLLLSANLLRLFIHLLDILDT